MKYKNRLFKIDISPDVSVEYDGTFKIVFEVKKSIIANNNSMFVEIYNLSETTRNRITSDINSLVRLQAGYADNTGLIEIGVGNVSNVNTIFNLPTIITKVYAKDGFNATRSKRVNLSFAENCYLGEIIDVLIEELGLPVRYIDYNKSIVLKTGYAFAGSISYCLDQLSLQFGFVWSIQNGQLMIVNKERGTGARVVLLSPESGLLNSPEEVIVSKFLKKDIESEYKVRSLMQPQLEAGDLVAIESRALEGVFMIQELTHAGDTTGDSWYTDMIVKRRNG